MAQRSVLALPDGATSVITRLVEHYQRQPELVWMYGQGSVFCGLRNDSDLDLIFVWDQLPAANTLPHQLTDRWIPHGVIALEKATIDGYDVDT